MLPPGPPIPSALQLLAWVYQPGRFFDHCFARHGAVFTMRLPGHAPKVMLGRHEAIKAVFSGDPACFHAGAANALVEPLVGPRSVLLLDGAAHQRKRRLLLSMFGGRAVIDQARAMREIAEETADAWPDGAEILAQPALQTLALRVILATIFGVRGDGRARRLEPMLIELLDHAESPLLLVPALQRDLGPLTPWRRFLDLKRALDEELQPIFAERRRAAEGADILSRLVAARDEEGKALSDAELRDELVTLLVAGHETTANALSWTLHRVLSHPEVEARLRGELDEVLGDREIEPEHLDSLPFLDATVQEGLRLDPVIGHVGRAITAPMTIGGHALPAGTMVVPCIYLAHRDPAVFPEPTRFLPERFLGGAPGPYSYLPFGGGVRRCIGMTFALHEMKIVLATLLRRVRLTLRPGSRPGVTRRGVVWAPSGGVPVRVEQRETMSYRSIFRPDLLAGQVIVITGGGSGIGRCVAHETASLGARVVLVGRKRERLEATAAEIAGDGGQAEIAACDVREEAAVVAAVEQIAARHPVIHGLVNNAGGQFQAPLDSMSQHGFETVLRTNLVGGFVFAREVFKQSMRHHGGSIVNMAADVTRGTPSVAHSGAARAGMIHFTQTAAVEWASFGVRVNAVAPGFIATAALARYGAQALEGVLAPLVPLGRLGTEAEVSAAVCFLLSEGAAYVSGATLRIDGAAPAAHPLFPGAAHGKAPAFDGFHRSARKKPAG